MNGVTAMTATTEAITAEVAAVESASNAAGRAAELLLESTRLVVRADTYESAVNFLRGVKKLGREIESERRSYTDPLNAVVKSITDRYRPGVDACAKAEKLAKGKLAAYDDAVAAFSQRVEAAAAEKQRRLEEKLRVEAETARRAEETALRRAEEARAAGDAAAAKVAEQEAARKAAIADRREERAEIVSAAPVVVAVVDKPTAEGIGYTTTYSAEVTDVRALAAAVLAGTVPAEAIQANEKYLGQVARSLKGSVSWPGVRWIARKTVRAGR